MSFSGIAVVIAAASAVILAHSCHGQTRDNFISHCAMQSNFDIVHMYD